MAIPDCIRTILHKCAPWIAMPICILTLMVQMAILDYFLIVHTSRDLANGPFPLNTTENETSADGEPTHYLWYLWVLPDIVVLALFITAFVKCHHHFTHSKKKAEKVGIGGELPFGYITWGAYSILTSTKLAIIFRWTAQSLNEQGFFGPNLLKTAISLASIVYVCLVLNHHDAPKGSSRATFIITVTHSVTMDVLDTSEILQVIFIQESHIFLSFELHKAIIAVACINLILPTVLLFSLSKSRFLKDERCQKILTIIHKVLFVVLINVPLLVLRVVLWHVHSTTVSVFVVKNVISLGIVVRVIHMQVIGAVDASKTTMTPSEIELKQLRPEQPKSDDDHTA